MEIEINGLKYRQRDQVLSRSRNVGRMAAMIEAMGMMKSQKTLNVNIIEEFRLIQEKKCKLSRKNRDWVVYQFNRNFQLITT